MNADAQEAAAAPIEWHVMVGVRGWRVRVVGLVEAVDASGIRVTRMERAAGPLVGTEIFLPWREVVYLMMSGPDHDEELFEAASRWREEVKGRAPEDVEAGG